MRCQTLCILQVPILVLVLRTDAARSSLKAARHFRSLAALRRLQLSSGGESVDGVLALHSKCLMHQLALVVARMVQDSLLGQPFRQRTMAGLLIALKTHFHARARVRVEGGCAPSSPA